MPNSEISIISNFLSKVTFFSEVNPASLNQLCEKLSVQLYRKNETIFNKNDEGESMFVILKGKVKIHEEDYIYDYLDSGECFGEYALIDNQTRSASVTTTENTELIKIEREHFMELMQIDTGFAQGILNVLIKRHRELDTIQEQLASSKEAIENANLKMSGLINGAMDAIIMFNVDFRIILTNPSANELLENDDPSKRNILFFFDEESAHRIENMVKNELLEDSQSDFIKDIVKVIGSNNTETLNEGTLSKYGNGKEAFYTLILRNIEERLKTEEKITTLTTKANYLNKELNELKGGYGIIAEDKGMIKALKMVEQVATTDASVLIHGETGTGKELIANAIHKSSNRSNEAMIRINCGAIPINLIESELFGHEKGAFTGASSSRKGRFLLADRGTVFLDEIGELPLELQPKLLRVIQEGEFEPLGSSTTIKVNVRIIAATHRDLLQFSKEGKFREDLYYRLNVFPIDVPALRHRGDDVILIAQQILEKFSLKLNKPPIALPEADQTLLKSYEWPGNVRELLNLIERAVIVSQNGMIDWNTIIPYKNNHIEKNRTEEDIILTAIELQDLEKENILSALRKTVWKISGANGAAALLGIPATTLTSKIKAFNIVRPI